MTERIAALDWRGIAAELDANGCAVVNGLATPETCAALAASYEVDEAFRSRIVMARHGFGRGEYKYFAYPLPEPVAALREAFYPHLATAANRWAALLGAPGDYPRSLYRYNPSRHYVDAVLRYAAMIRSDPRAFYVLYSRQVFVRTPHGLIRLTGPR